MYVSCDLQILINSNKPRSEEITVNLREAATSVETFKQHVLSECKLSPSEHDKYMLSYLYINYQVVSDDSNEESKVAPFYMPLVSDRELKQYLMQVVQAGRKIAMRIEKNALADEMQHQVGEIRMNKRMIISSKSRQLQKTRQAKNEIQFNPNGQVIRDNFQVLQERPHYKIHPIIGEYEVCAFCRGPSDSEDLRIKCGPMYGPIKVGGTGSAYVHELCALWTPEIFLNESNKFKNLIQGIRRCNKIKCTLCKEKGGGLGCFIRDCHKSYHYLCAKETKCLFVNSKFIIYCEDHRLQAPEEYLEEEKLEEEINDGLEHYICSICKSGLDEDHIVICEGCDRGFHSNCHDPIIDIDTMTEDQVWHCKSCSLEAQL